MIVHSACRVCGGELEDLLFLGNHPLPDFSQTEPNWEYAPLSLVQCGSCTLIQLRHTVDREKLFSNYWYRSGLSETMVAALKEVAEKSLEFAGEGHTVVDIGSNDGTFLDMLNQGMTKIGFEPSDSWSEMDGKRVVQEFFNEAAFERLNVPSAKLVTTIAMFYSVEDPSVFVRDVAKILLPGGVWINQMNDLVALFANNAYDIIGHEHTCVWSLNALAFLLDRYGLEVFRVERIPLNGGTARFYIQHKGQRPIEKSVADQQAHEAGLLHNPNGHAFAIDEATTKLHKLIRHLRKEGRKIYIYGASTRGVTIVHAAQLDETLIQGATERDESKVGKLFPGTRIPIVSERDMRIAQPDYLLALPYSYLPQFQKREQDWARNGGRWIIPIPTPQVVR